MTDKEFDDGLKAVMGDRFHGETETDAIVREHAAKRRTAEGPGTCKNAPKGEKPVKAQWEPVKPDPNWLDNLKACAKWTAIFGGLCVLFFDWQQTGQMAASAAVPSMCACCLLAGLSIGMNVVRGES